MMLTQTPAWLALQEHYKTSKHIQMREQFANDSRRFKRFSVKTDDLFLDFSKNRIDQTTMDLLTNLAKERELEQLREAMFNGDKINFTEQRAAMHTGLRNRSRKAVLVNDKNVKPKIKDVLKRIKRFAEKVREEKWTGYSGRPIKNIINIGIGGSHLGPVLASDALAQYGKPGMKSWFVSSADITPVLENIDPETCLFIVVSKTFSTKETLVNAEIAKAWLTRSAGDQNAVGKHFVAVSSNIRAASAFGIDEKNIFEFWDWVGGRYSLWSAVGLSTILLIGMDNFEAMLEGAWRMDEHFRKAPLDQNMPVIMALLGIWYCNFYGSQTQAVIPYDDRLKQFPSHLQQLDMESNGKSVTSSGEDSDVSTGPVIFGSTGPDCQHAYFQSIHQGSHLIPVDFITTLNNPLTSKEQHESLLANCFAQSETMMRGQSAQEIRATLKASGHNLGEIELLTPHKIMPGNKPSNTLLLNELTPASLGALIALYEHKIFVQGVIWNINSFDQWGVELGKLLADQIELDFHRKKPGHHDCSTEGLMKKVRSGRF